MYEELVKESLACYQKIYDWLKVQGQEKPGYQALHNKQQILVLPKNLTGEFSRFVDKISVNLMEQRENFYGYFLLQMTRKIDFYLASPTGVNFAGGKFVLYFNPLLFLPLSVDQMFTTIQHEILHLVSMHLQRAKDMQGKYRKLVINLAMDLTVNNYLTNLPPDAVDLATVNKRYSIDLKPYESLEFYADALEKAIRADKINNPQEDEGDSSSETEAGAAVSKFLPEKTHDLWEAGEPVEDSVLNSFLEQYVEGSARGNLSGHVADLVKILRDTVNELPWPRYLRKMLGSVATGYKHTTARRNRRQPERADLPGSLRRYQPKVGVALDISGSISDGEFKQAMKEVLGLVRTYKQPITVMECDDRLRRVYKVRSFQDIKDRFKEKAGTAYSPVIERSNKEKFDLLVYFTDGQGEKKLTVEPRGYKILWVLSGDGEKLSLGDKYGIVKKLQPVKKVCTLLDSYDVEQGGFSMNHQEEITLGNEY
jgi:predicted metal-dependent peptidase